MQTDQISRFQYKYQLLLLSSSSSFVINLNISREIESIFSMYATVTRTSEILFSQFCFHKIKKTIFQKWM